MTPDDRRHGTNAGYLAGCRDACCRTAHADYRRRLRTRQYLAQGALTVDGLGTRRRLQALVALGWSLHQVDAELGQRRSYSHHLMTRPGYVLAATAKRVAEVYERLSMRLPDESTLHRRQAATRNRNLARGRGWPPPLAWDDIDDPTEQPVGWEYQPADRRTLLLELTEQGLGITEVCRRLHVSRDSLQKWCGNNQLSHLYQSLAVREAVQSNQHLDTSRVA